MCKLAAFPPGFPKSVALEIMEVVGAGQDDGTGVGWLNKEAGKFFIKKLPLSYSEIKKRIPTLDLLKHMPYDGWTVVHGRTATNGEVVMRNTHPFVRNGLLGVHNGVMSGTEVVRKIINPDPKSWASETDSEVGIEILSRLGPVDFIENMSSAGVILTINKAGEMMAVKSSGSLSYGWYGDQIFFATNIPGHKYLDEVVEDGYVIMNPDGSIKEWVQKATNYWARQNHSVPTYKTFDELKARRDRRVIKAKDDDSKFKTPNHDYGGCNTYSLMNNKELFTNKKLDHTTGTDFYDETGAIITDKSIIGILEKKYANAKECV